MTKDMCLFFPETSQPKLIGFEKKEKKKLSTECRAKKCSNILKGDWTSRLDPRYCLGHGKLGEESRKRTCRP